MRIVVRPLLASVVLSVLSLSCVGEEGRGRDAREPDPTFDFASYAEDLFVQLRREPLDSSLQTETGLFGDMSVGAGESVVMGRYRLRVDSQPTGRVGYMAFQIRDARRNYEPIPIVLRFVSEAGRWRLDDAQAHPRESESTSLEASGTTEAEPESPNGTGGLLPDSLEQSLGLHLEDWTRTAVEKLETP